MINNDWIYLASQSPRRAQLLKQIGVEFKVVTAEVDESRLPNESPSDYVCRLALAKADSAWQELQQEDSVHPLIAADTAVVVNNDILTKPRDQEEAKAMIRKLSGRSHQVFTAVAGIADRRTVRLNESTVHMRRLNDAEVLAYVASGEGTDKAGAYAVQGLGAVFITELHGSYSGVMGLPLYETGELLKTLGYTVLKA